MVAASRRGGGRRPSRRWAPRPGTRTPPARQGV